jgi:hypothetical protein
LYLDGTLIATVSNASWSANLEFVTVRGMSNSFPNGTYFDDLQVDNATIPSVIPCPDDKYKSVVIGD